MSSGSVRSKKRRCVQVACNACRARKTAVSPTPVQVRLEAEKSQCDARRPACGSCSARSSTCIYDSAPGESRATTLKRENEELRESLTDLRQSFERLHDLTDDEILSYFRQSRDLDYSSKNDAVARVPSPSSSLPSRHVARSVSKADK